MKKLAAMVLVLVGIVAALFGLLFLVGAAGQMARYVVAALGLLGGGGLIALGVRLYRAQRGSSPDLIAAEILSLAKGRSGELSESDLRAGLGARLAAAGPVLVHMQREGLCEGSDKSGERYYTFPGLLPRLMVRRCEFCEAELPLEEELISCPKCGGDIKTGVEKVALEGGDAYSMDE